ncbi:MAG TPA: hypothetical protein VL131_05225 [Gammaproteobacteria bacterium]|nr:hypothetical protein [Gammaproteobacteria bacterium]
MTNAPRSSRSGHAHGADGRDDARDAGITRSAWLLAGVALAFYVGYIAWFLWRSVAGS